MQKDKGIFKGLISEEERQELIKQWHEETKASQKNIFFSGKNLIKKKAYYKMLLDFSKRNKIVNELNENRWKAILNNFDERHGYCIAKVDLSIFQHRNELFTLEGEKKFALKAKIFLKNVEKLLFSNKPNVPFIELKNFTILKEIKKLFQNSKGN